MIAACIHVGWCVYVICTRVSGDAVGVDRNGEERKQERRLNRDVSLLWNRLQRRPRSYTSLRRRGWSRKSTGSRGESPASSTREGFWFGRGEEGSFQVCVGEGLGVSSRRWLCGTASAVLGDGGCCVSNAYLAWQATVVLDANGFCEHGRSRQTEWWCACVGLMRYKQRGRGEGHWLRAQRRPCVR